MGKEERFGDKINTNGFEKNKQNINRKGAKPSLKKAIARKLKEDGCLPIPVKFFEKKDKDNYYFKIPTQDALAMKLITMAMGSKKDAFNALKLLIETFDGKAVQSVLELNTTDMNGDIIVQDDKTKEMVKKLRDDSSDDV